jgi:hypothetical protein
MQNFVIIETFISLSRRHTSTSVGIHTFIAISTFIISSCSGVLLRIWFRHTYRGRVRQGCLTIGSQPFVTMNGCAVPPLPPQSIEPLQEAWQGVAMAIRTAAWFAAPPLYPSFSRTAAADIAIAAHFLRVVMACREFGVAFAVGVIEGSTTEAPPPKVVGGGVPPPKVIEGSTTKASQMDDGAPPMKFLYPVLLPLSTL